MIDLSEQKQKEIMTDYGELVCEKCKDKLREAMKPIKERLDKGKSPKLKHINKLMRTLCPPCFAAIAKQKNNH